MDSTRQGAAVTARGIGIKGPRGWVFRGIDIDAEPGSLIVIEGPSGSGRTCLLLALTGRMRITEGHATVAGAFLPKRMGTLRAVTAIAHVPGIADLEPALTVGEHLQEQALLGHRLTSFLPWGRRQKEAAKARIDAALAAVALDPKTLPKGLRTHVRDLERLEALRLSIALAMMHGPRLLAVDDVDLKLSETERAQAWDLLRDLALGGVTVVAAGGGAPQGAVRVSTAQAASTLVAASGSAGSAGSTDSTHSAPEEDPAHAFAETRRA